MPADSHVRNAFFLQELVGGITADMHDLHYVFHFINTKRQFALPLSSSENRAAWQSIPPGACHFAVVLFAHGSRTAGMSAHSRAFSRRPGGLHRSFTGPFTRPAAWELTSALRKYHCDLCLSWPSLDCLSRVEAMSVIARARALIAHPLRWLAEFPMCPGGKGNVFAERSIQFSSFSGEIFCPSLV